jgi:ceramide glucosyltransferase
MGERRAGGRVMLVWAAQLHALLLSLVFTGSVVAALVRRYRRAPPFATSPMLRVTALKPLRGVDPGLEANLESFAAISLPVELEVLLLVDRDDDAALPVAKAVAARHPTRVRVLVGTDPSASNPKVGSLLFGLRSATHPILWVTDSNVLTSDAHVRSQLETWAAASAKGKPTLIHAPLAAIEGSGLGAAFERAHLASYNNLSAETTLVAGVHAVVGKSLVMTREDLDAVGGLSAFAHISGEDFEMGRAFEKVGTVRSSQRATRQVLGTFTASDFYKRQMRWATIRKRMTLFTYAVLEPFTYFALLPLWAALGWLRWELVAGLFAFKMLADAALIGAFGELRLRDVALIPLKDVVVFAAWVGAFFQTTVSWRGRTLDVQGANYAAQKKP